MSDAHFSTDDARRRLEGAARTLGELSRFGGEAAPDPASEAAVASGLRAALAAARGALEEKARELESARLRARALERERDELSKRLAAIPLSAPEPGAEERARRAEDEAKRAREDSAREAASLGGRVALLQAEIVRLESLRRKAEDGVVQAELSRRSVEQALRGELREAHAATDRAAADAGARDARAAAEASALQRRLEAALKRIEQLERERRVERDKARAERERLASLLQRGAAAQAALRRDLADEREAHDARGRENDRSLEAARGALERMREAAGLGGKEDQPRPVRETARLVARLRPSVEAAYGRLRELSSTLPLSDAERAPLRRAASALAGLVDSVSRLSRFIDDGPPGSAGPVGPALEKAIERWRPSLENAGVSVSVSVDADLPDARRDLNDLALILDELLRNASERLPRGARLTASATRSAAGGVELAIEDDGPGLPSRLAADAFAPVPDPKPGRLGIGLALVRRVARRWNGDAVLDAPAGGGARFALTLPPA